MDPWGLGLALLTLLTVIGPVALNACLVGFLIQGSRPFCEDLKGIMTAGACRFLRPIRLRGNGDRAWWRILLLLEGRDSG